MPVGARFTASVMPVALTRSSRSVPVPLPVAAVTVQTALGADPTAGATFVTCAPLSPVAASWKFSFESPETASLKVTVQLTTDCDVGLALARTIDWAAGAVRSTV